MLPVDVAAAQSTLSGTGVIAGAAMQNSAIVERQHIAGPQARDDAALGPLRQLEQKAEATIDFVDILE